ncbi:MAG: hypothetical protein ICV77_10120 [Cyanobacteria bacterium Co-bin8]|nr:hypothetical protein [Cyanobacteria bacterium Co-bin8]
MKQGISCKYCGAPIRSRATLAVVGRGLQPLHTRCYPAYAAQQPWYRKPGWPVNRWRSLLPFNALLLSLVLALHFTVAPVAPSQWLGLGQLLLVVNAWLLVARLISYWSLERHLPPREPTDVRGV